MVLSIKGFSQCGLVLSGGWLPVTPHSTKQIQLKYDETEIPSVIYVSLKQFDYARINLLNSGLSSAGILRELTALD